MKNKRKILDQGKATLRILEEFRSRFGAVKMLQHAAFRFVNRFFYLDCLHIIVLDRGNLRALDPVKSSRFRSKIATLEDLKEMEEQGCWGIHKGTFEYFSRGDTCLLSYVDNKLAGYTWVLTGGGHAFFEGLSLSMPDEYLYNFGGFTHPDFRGLGLQSFRHHELLSDNLWKDKKGLLGIVVHTNHSSRRGQVKGGYEGVGSIYVVGRKSNVHAYIGKNVRTMGIKRINPTSSPLRQFFRMMWKLVCGVR